MGRKFNKIAMSTDQHFGAKSNSEQHLRDLVDYFDWFIKEARDFGAETCVLGGDWHNNRASISTLTLDYSLKCMEKISESFEQVYFISGNHDLHFRDKRDVSSVSFGKLLENVVIVQDPLVVDNVRFQPWLVGKEWEEVKNWKEDIVFGHFEIPGFLLNSMVESIDYGEINYKHFKNQQYVFSGHFHKRQSQGNIHYIGNAFPHNYADAWDFERGCMLFSMDEMKPIYRDWDKAPRYITTELSELIKQPEYYLTPQTHARITIDVDLSYEELAVIRDELKQAYNVRELELNPKSTADDISKTVNIDFHSVDQLIMDGLKAVDSATIDNKLLVQIYERLA